MATWTFKPGLRSNMRQPMIGTTTWTTLCKMMNIWMTWMSLMMLPWLSLWKECKTESCQCTDANPAICLPCRDSLLQLLAVGSSASSNFSLSTRQCSHFDVPDYFNSLLAEQGCNWDIEMQHTANSTLFRVSTHWHVCMLSCITHVDKDILLISNFCFSAKEECLLAIVMVVHCTLPTTHNLQSLVARLISDCS